MLKAAQVRGDTELEKRAGLSCLRRALLGLRAVLGPGLMEGVPHRGTPVVVTETMERVVWADGWVDGAAGY